MMMMRETAPIRLVGKLGLPTLLAAASSQFRVTRSTVKFDGDDD